MKRHTIAIFVILQSLCIAACGESPTNSQIRATGTNEPCADEDIMQTWRTGDIEFPEFYLDNPACVFYYVSVGGPNPGSFTIAFSTTTNENGDKILRLTNNDNFVLGGASECRYQVSRDLNTAILALDCGANDFVYERDLNR